jgi:general secretion pathway protein K
MATTSGLERRDESRRGRQECLRHAAVAHASACRIGTHADACVPSKSRGSALLAVLWLSAALAAIAFALSTTVRGETERTATSLDSLRSYYLASGALDRAAVELLWSGQRPETRKIPRGSTMVTYEFPSGEARVEIVPETGKLDINHAPVERLYRLMVALGIEAERARQITLGIDEYRRPTPGGVNPFGGSDSPLSPTFRPSNASFQEIEELLLVKGVTPDIFYGTYTPVAERAGGPRLTSRTGLVDCLSVYGSGDRVDANTAAPAVLAAVGLDPFTISTLVERRRLSPLTQQQLSGFPQSNSLRVEGNSIVTMRATARLRLANGQLSDLKRTVAAQVKYMPPEYESPIHILRWYDTAWSQ